MTDLPLLQEDERKVKPKSITTQPHHLLDVLALLLDDEMTPQDRYLEVTKMDMSGIIKSTTERYPTYRDQQTENLNYAKDVIGGLEAYAELVHKIQNGHTLSLNILPASDEAMCQVIRENGGGIHCALETMNAMDSWNPGEEDELGTMKSYYYDYEVILNLYEAWNFFQENKESILELDIEMNNHTRAYDALNSLKGFINNDGELPISLEYAYYIYKVLDDDYTMVRVDEQNGAIRIPEISIDQNAFFTNEELDRDKVASFKDLAHTSRHIWRNSLVKILISK
jgi:hypothetical protein